MKIITVLNEKGGVGKTTLAVNISSELAHMGHKVLLVDADPQGNVATSVGLQEEPCLYDLMIRDANWVDVIRPVSAKIGNGNLYLVPGNIESRAIPLQLRDPWKLDTRLRQLSDAFDYIVIDTAPTPSLFHSAILTATDEVFVPTQLEKLSIKGVVSTLGHITANNERARIPAKLAPIRVLAIVPTMARMNTLEHRENFEALNKKFEGNVIYPIAERTVWVEASHAGLPVRVYDPKSEVANELQPLLGLILMGEAVYE